MIQASLAPSSLAQWVEVMVQLGGLLGAWMAWVFSRRCRIHVRLHLSGSRDSGSTPDGLAHAYGSCALVVENVGSRIGRGVQLSATPRLTFWSRPMGADKEAKLVELDDWELGDMPPAQRYEFAFELIDREGIERLMASELTVSHKRVLGWDYSTTMRIGGPGLVAVNLADTTSPAGMVASPLRSVAESLREIRDRPRPESTARPGT